MRYLLISFLKRFAIILMAFFFCGPSSVFSQTNSVNVTNGFSSFPERLSITEQFKSDQIPPATLEVIRRQNEILIQQGRKIAVRSYSRSTSSACGTCRDMGVENGWDVWQAEAGENYDSLGLNLIATAPIPPRFNITSGAGIDPLTPGLNPGDPPITLVAPPGFGTSSIQLGQPRTDGQGGACTSFQNPFAAGCAERLTYCFTVGVNDTNFVYAYAFVMENPDASSHTIETMPYVEFMILDAAGDTISCAFQRYIASETFPGQYKCNSSRWGGGGGQDTAIYKPWTIEGVNLSTYIGQTLTVVITNADCRLGGHFAHSYWDFACGSSAAIFKPNCYTNTPDTLVAPSAPDSVNTYAYQWFLNSDPNPIAFTQVITPYAQPGDTFMVKVILPSGCNWAARYIPQHFTVTADFNFTTHCGFANFAAQSFSPSVEDPINYWSWNFSSGSPSTSNDANPAAVIFPPGNHTVTLISGTYSPGCRDTVQYTINVPQVPVASFTVSDVCAGNQVPILNTSSIAVNDTISSYSWYIGGGNPNTSSAFDPVTTISSPGTKQVVLVVNSTRGCRDTVQHPVNIHEYPAASFSAPSICFGQDISIQNNSSISAAGGTLTYSWSFPGGIPSSSSSTIPLVSFATPDTFPVTLIANSSYGCADTIQKSIVVKPIPHADFLSPQVCSGSAIQIQNHSSVVSGDSIVSYSWYFPNGNPTLSTLFQPTVTYYQPDTLMATLVVTNKGGCKDTVLGQLIITPDPIASFNASSICLGNQVQIQNNSSSIPVGETLTYDWSISNGSPGSSAAVQPLVTYSNPGTSTIRLIASAIGGCKDTLEKTISIYPSPLADFSAPHVCSGSPIQIVNNSSVLPGDSIVSYSWYFPSGVPTLSNAFQPTVVYDVPDTLMATLVITNKDGCKDTTLKQMIVTPDPLADFSAPSVCLGNDVQVQNSSTSIPAGELLTYDWTVSNGIPGTSTDSEPLLTYADPGSSTIRLIVSAAGGCKDTLEKIISIFPLPIADFIAPSGCFGSSVSFSNLSTAYAGDSIDSYAWTIPNAIPSNSTLVNPVVTFQVIDSSMVNLMTTTIHGCKDTISKQVFVSADPIADFSLSDICAGSEISFLNSSTIQPAGENINYAWTIAGGSIASSSVAGPVVTFPMEGSFPVSLIARADGGCADTALHTITVFPLPQSVFTSPAACKNGTTTLSNLSSVTGDVISNFYWSVPQGQPAVSQLMNPIIKFDTAGIFSLSLIVETQNGCRDSSSGQVTVHDLPLVLIDIPDSGCVPICHTYYDYSVSTDGLIDQWSWNFPGGEPRVSYSQNPPVVCYEDPGFYDAILSVVSSYGCISHRSFKDFIKVYPNPNADFEVSSEISGYNSPNFTFTNQSSSDVVQWTWNFGDGSADFNGGPIETYSYSSATQNDFYDYVAKLLVTTAHGCKDSTVKPLEINPDFTFFVPNAITPNGNFKNDLFYAKGMGIRNYEISVFDRWGLEIWSCHQEGSNIPWDIYGNEGMPSSCQWDGRVKGEQVQQDVYVWRAKVIDVFGKGHVYIGTVTVHF